MAIIRKKTRKAITKQVTKLMKKHGPEIAMGLVSNLLTGFTAAAMATPDDDKSEKKKKKSDNGDSNSKSKKKRSKK